MAKLGNFLHSSTEQHQASVESKTLGQHPKNASQEACYEDGQGLVSQPKQKLTKQKTQHDGQQRKNSMMQQTRDIQGSALQISKFLPGHRSPKAGEQDLQDREDLSMDDEPHISVGQGTQDSDALVKFGVDMTELSNYLDNIIQVVNQHAKLLDQVSEELEARPKATEVGELYATMSQSYPYERVLN